jgi:hypothetical protein
MTLLQINQEHPDYGSKKHTWRVHRDLYAGGEQLKQHAPEYLLRRQKEPVEVYQERLSRVFYENYVGSIIDWYVATLFRREPVLIVEGNDSAGKRFLQTFVEDCDWKGSSIVEFFRGQILETLVTGVSYTLVDFPRTPQPLENRAEEEVLGVARAYLVPVPAESLINWGTDERGNLDWVVLRSEYNRRESMGDDGWTTETIWTYYDRQRFQKYSACEKDGKQGAMKLVDSGFHGLAGQNQVPLYPLRIPDGLWLMNKAGLLQLEHFNKSNGLAWALTMGLFATPVVYSDREWTQVIGDSYYLQLGPNDKFGWTEPEGNVYQIAADNLNRLQEEIYRVCYLMSQAGGPLRGVQQSGLSKQRDFAITQEVLRAYGDAVKEALKTVLRVVIAARQDKLALDVSGMDEFDIGDFSDELNDAERLLKMGIESPTLKKQVFKKLAFKFLSDVRQELKDQISREIDFQIDRHKSERE